MYFNKSGITDIFMAREEDRELDLWDKDDLVLE